MVGGWSRCPGILAAACRKSRLFRTKVVTAQVLGQCRVLSIHLLENTSSTFDNEAGANVSLPCLSTTRRTLRDNSRHVFPA
jgi:hypothetical protein